MLLEKVMFSRKYDTAINLQHNMTISDDSFDYVSAVTRSQRGLNTCKINKTIYTKHKCL